MKSSITAGLDKDLAAEITENFKHSGKIRRRLIEMLEKDINTKRSQSCDSKRYENANWAYYQAHMMGYEEGLRDAISLLSENN